MKKQFISIALALSMFAQVGTATAFAQGTTSAIPNGCVGNAQYDSITGVACPGTHLGVPAMSGAALSSSAATAAALGQCKASFSGLKIGVRGQSVLMLQQLLNRDSDTQVSVSGAGSRGNETQVFGPATRAAIMKFQAKYKDEILAPLGLTAPTGNVGPATAKKLVAIYCSDQSGLVHVSSVTSPANVGDKVTITGTGFSAKGNAVVIGDLNNPGMEGAIQNLDSADGKTISFTLPEGAGHYCYQNPSPTAGPVFCTTIYVLFSNGSHSLYVASGAGKSNVVNFVIGTTTPAQKPVINSISPVSGPVETTVVIKGKNLVNYIDVDPCQNCSGPLNNVSLKDGTQVTFGSGAIPADQLKATTTSDGSYGIQFDIPAYLNPACLYTTPACAIASRVVTPGDYPISVTINGQTSNKVTFTVEKSDVISIKEPASGATAVLGSDLPVVFGYTQSGDDTAKPSTVSVDVSLIVPPPTCPNGLACPMMMIKPFTLATGATAKADANGNYVYDWTVGKNEENRTIGTGTYKMNVCLSGFPSVCDTGDAFTISNAVTTGNY